MKLIDKDTLVAEVESKKKYAQTLGDNAINRSMQQFYDGMKQGCVDILSFLDTLEVKEVQEEPVSEDLHHIVDTKAKELWDEMNTGHEYSILDSYNQFLGICMEIAETIKEEHVCVKNKLNALSDGKQHLGWIDDAMALEMGEELAKEVEDYIDVNGFDGLDSVEKVKSIACHFANWQKEQMMKDAITARCFGFQSPDALFSIHLPAKGYLVGHELRVIIVKED